MTSSTMPVATIPAKTNLWPIRVVSLLLALQGVGLLVLSLVWVMQVDWLQRPLVWPTADPAWERFVLGLLLLPVAFFLLLTAVGFLFLQRAAWLTAMLAQGFILFNGLSNYFAAGSTLRTSHLLYGMLLSAIVLVLYLNTNDVRQAFTLRQSLLDAPPLTQREFERIETRRAPRVEEVDEHAAR